MNVTSRFGQGASDPQKALFQREVFQLTESTVVLIGDALLPLLPLPGLVHLVCTYFFSSSCFLRCLQPESVSPHTYLPLADDQIVHTSAFSREEALLLHRGAMLCGIITMHNLGFTPLRQPIPFDTRSQTFGRGRIYTCQEDKVVVSAVTQNGLTPVEILRQVPALSSRESPAFLDFDRFYKELVVVSSDGSQVSAYQENGQPSAFSSSFQTVETVDVFFAQRISPEHFLLVSPTFFQVVDTQKPNAPVLWGTELEKGGGFVPQQKFCRAYVSESRDVLWTEVEKAPDKLRCYSLVTGDWLRQVTWGGAIAFATPFQRGVCLKTSLTEPLRFFSDEDSVVMASTLGNEGKAFIHQIFFHATGFVGYYRCYDGVALLGFPFPVTGPGRTVTQPPPAEGSGEGAKGASAAATGAAAASTH